MTKIDLASRRSPPAECRSCWGSPSGDHSATKMAARPYLRWNSGEPRSRPIRADGTARDDSSTARVRGDRSPPSTASAHGLRSPPAPGTPIEAARAPSAARLWAKFVGRSARPRSSRRPRGRGSRSAAGTDTAARPWCRPSRRGCARWSPRPRRAQRLTMYSNGDLTLARRAAGARNSGDVRIVRITSRRSPSVPRKSRRPLDERRRRIVGDEAARQLRREKRAVRRVRGEQVEHLLAVLARRRPAESCVPSTRLAP